MPKTLKTDREFLLLSLPITAAQQIQLETSLMQDGCKEPVITWNGVIIDGYKRYRFCMAEGIDFAVEERSFHSVEEAISWTCRQKMSNADKDTPLFRYLAGKLYNAQKEVFRVIRQQPEEERAICLNSERRRVSYYVADELQCVNRTSVEIYGGYAAALEQIADKAKGLFEAILLGKVNLSIKQTRSYATLSEKELRDLCWGEWRLPIPIDQSTRIRERIRKIPPVQSTNAIPLSVGIKNMPTYDPDMELRGLTLTIPTWIMAISRVEKKTAQATDHAKEQLSRSLRQLKEQIDEMLGAMNNE